MVIAYYFFPQNDTPSNALARKPRVFCYEIRTIRVDVLIRFLARGNKLTTNFAASPLSGYIGDRVAPGQA